MREWHWRAYALTTALMAIICMAAAGCGAQGRPAATAGGQQQAQAPDAAAAADERQRQGSAAVAGAEQDGAAGATAPAKPGDLQEDELQSRKDKLLVVTFVALLQLDKKPGLAITAGEAQALLPIVRRGKEQGELSLDEQKALDGALTAEQAKFVADFRSRIGSQRRNRPELTPEQRDAMIAKFNEQRKRQPDNDGGAAGSDNAGSAKSGGERTLEQQLLDVLQSKLTAAQQKP